MEQFICGLNSYNLIPIIRENPKLFQYIFCQNSYLDWTYEKFDHFVDPYFSELGSSKRKLEVDTYKAFMDAMEEMFHTGTFLLIYFLEPIFKC